MKITDLKLLFSTALLFAGPVLADEMPIIDCVSINHWSSSTVTTSPLPPNRVLHLHFAPVSSSLPNYKMTLTWKRADTGTVLGNSEEVWMSLVRDPQTHFTYSWIGARPNNGTGRFTFGDLATSFSDPFIMYGWSTVPKTMNPAMEYRCQVWGWNSI